MYHPLLLLAGMLVLYNHSHLPSVLAIVILLLISVWLFKLNQYKSRLLVVMMMGYCWAAIISIDSMSQNLPQQIENKTVEITGCISQIKNYSQRYQRLTIDVEHSQSNQLPIQFHGKISLANYEPLDIKITTGWCGRFVAKLKPVHGRLNQHLFDFEAWAYVENIRAIGTLKSAHYFYPGNSFWHQFLRAKAKLIQIIYQQYQHSTSYGLLISLALGERNYLSEDTWSVLRKSGTSHLLAISGLHIGLVFWLASLICSFIWKWVPGGLVHFSAQKVGWASGLMVSAGYLALTGFPLSGKRAWVMLLISIYFMMANKKNDFKHALSTTLIVVLLIWPSSVLSMGFWFSFIAVSLILTQFMSVNLLPINWSTKLLIKNNYRSQFFQQLLTVVMIQCVLSIAMMPLTLFYFGEISFVSVVANFLAVPTVSFLILPLILFGIVLLMGGFTAQSFFVLDLPLRCLEWLHMCIQKMVEFKLSWVEPIIHNQLALIFAFFGVFVWLVFRAWPGRWILLLLVLPLFVSSKSDMAKAEFKITIFDVGQGLAMWLQTSGKNILVDTGYGSQYGFSHFNNTIYPFLRRRGVRKLDLVVISHDDADHAGGLPAMERSNLSPDLIYISDTQENSTFPNCKRGTRWRWDDVEFEFLTNSRAGNENNQSCILKISSEFGTALLPGDIEKETERNLVKNNSDKLKSDILIVPHHGSKTSSTDIFLKHVKPEIAVFSSGFLNRYGHPANSVVERYQMRQIRLVNTACMGQIFLAVTANGIEVDSMRQKSPRFWRHQCSGLIK